MSEQSEKPKIIIDEDWKTQAQAEKEKLERQVHASPGESEDPSTASSSTPVQSPPPDAVADNIPPASLLTLITTLATQAMVSLGQIPDPYSGQPEVQLPHAKHFIDTLQVLEEKTADNRTPQESKTLENLLHELRIAYVEISKR